MIRTVVSSLLVFVCSLSTVWAGDVADAPKTAAEVPQIKAMAPPMQPLATAKTQAAANRFRVTPTVQVGAAGNYPSTNLNAVVYDGGATGTLKLVTPIVESTLCMFLLHLSIYRYSDGIMRSDGNTRSETIDIRCSGYIYPSDSTKLIQRSCSAVGTTLPVELELEGTTGSRTVVVRIGNSSSIWQSPTLSADYRGYTSLPSGWVWALGETTPAGTGGNLNGTMTGALTVGGTALIGKTAPVSPVPSGLTNIKLDVGGDINVDGNINAKYQDVAEWVPASSAMDGGTVVVLNGAKSNEVMPSSSAYDTRVAGVVSNRPGLLLGEGNASKAKIATTGRVKVKVDASKGAIAIGDLLVTSDKSGTAMKSEPIEINGRKFHQPGTIIGKALEPLASGDGEILVLLSLQ